uniref:Cuticular protein n=1 Tax=Papilio polytes TaxID=76194 RepID=I4DMF8_PAPPL|nr:unknown secreted protein [Papilio polytes]
MAMGSFPVIFIVFLLPHVYSAPPLISFDNGKLGVNFAGYHAAVGLGGLLGNGATGGLFAEAGTPHGQSARAGLGGAVDANGGTAGGLYAGATAGGNVKAGAGLAGGVNGDTSAGTGFAAAQAGNRYSSSTLFQAGGNAQLSSNEPAVQNDNVLPSKNIVTNELIPPVGSFKLKIKSSGVINDNANVPTNEEINGLIDASIVGYNDSPQIIQKRIDIGNENVNKNLNPPAQSVDQITYRKEVNLQRNPTFFEDIFNIPIAALTAVRTFLTNTASNTSVSLQKSGSIQADTY